jgi:HEAT repeat protein
MKSRKIGWFFFVLLIVVSVGIAALPPSAKAQNVDDLILSLEQGSRGQKLDAIRRLGTLGEIRALRPLLNSLQDRSDDLIRAESAKALGLIGDNRAASVLVTRLKEERVAMVRARIAESLGKLKDPRAVEALAAATTDSELIWVRLYAAWALGEIKDGRGIAPLLNMTLTGEHQFIYDEVNIALLKSADIWNKIEKGDTSLVYGSIQARKRIKSLKQFLIDMLTNQNEQIRLMAAESLGKYADAEGAEYLRRAAERDNSAIIRKAAQKGLANLHY